METTWDADAGAGFAEVSVSSNAYADGVWNEFIDNPFGPDTLTTYDCITGSFAEAHGSTVSYREWELEGCEVFFYDIPLSVSYNASVRADNWSFTAGAAELTLDGQAEIQMNVHGPDGSVRNFDESYAECSADVVVVEDEKITEHLSVTLSSGGVEGSGTWSVSDLFDRATLKPRTDTNRLAGHYDGSGRVSMSYHCDANIKGSTSNNAYWASGQVFAFTSVTKR